MNKFLLFFVTLIFVESVTQNDKGLAESSPGALTAFEKIQLLKLSLQSASSQVAKESFGSPALTPTASPISSKPSVPPLLVPILNLVTPTKSPVSSSPSRPPGSTSNPSFISPTALSSSPLTVNSKCPTVSPSTNFASSTPTVFQSTSPSSTQLSPLQTRSPTSLSPTLLSTSDFVQGALVFTQYAYTASCNTPSSHVLTFLLNACQYDGISMYYMFNSTGVVDSDKNLFSVMYTFSDGACTNISSTSTKLLPTTCTAEGATSYTYSYISSIPSTSALTARGMYFGYFSSSSDCLTQKASLATAGEYWNFNVCIPKSDTSSIQYVSCNCEFISSPFIFRLSCLLRVNTAVGATSRSYPSGNCTGGSRSSYAFISQCSARSSSTAMVQAFICK